MRAAAAAVVVGMAVEGTVEGTAVVEAAAEEEGVVVVEGAADGVWLWFF